MIGCVVRHRRLSVVDLVFLLLLLITASAADPSNLTQCVPQDNDRGLSFGCPMDSMIWVRVGYYGRSPSTSPSQFCENPTLSVNDCIPDPRGDLRLIRSLSNKFMKSVVYGKSYNDIVALCPSNNGGFPFAYVSYDCLPSLQTDGVNYIPTVNPSDNSVYREYYGKIYFLTSGYPDYPFTMSNKIVQFQVSVDGNTKVTIRLLDAFGRLLDAAGPCPYTLYAYSSVTNTYREWCVNRTSWSIDDSTVVFPAALQQGSGFQNIDVVFTKTNINQDAQGGFWMVVEAVNVIDNSPGRNITISCGSSFTSQGRPTPTTTTTTTTTPTTTTPTTTTPTTTTPTTTTPTTTTPTTTTPTTTTPTTTTPTTTTPTTTPTTTTPTTTTPTTTTPTTTSTTTTTTTTPTTPTPTTSTPTTTTTTTSTTTTPTMPASTATSSTARTTPTTTISTTTQMPSLAPATFSTMTSSSSVASSSVTSTTQALTSNNATESGVSLPTMTSSNIPTSRPTSGDNNNTAAALSSNNTNVIIGVVVAVVGVIIIIVIIVVVVVICRRNPDRKSKPRAPPMAGAVPTIRNYSNNNNDEYNDAAAAAAYKNSSTRLQGRDHIYDEIHEPSMGVMTVSYPPQQHHPAASPTILRIGRGQSRKAVPNGVNKVHFTIPGGDEGLIFYPGVSSNISDDDKANRQTAQNANEVHPRLMKNDFSSSKRLSFTGRQDSSSSTPSVPSKGAGDPHTGIQLNPVYGYRPADIYMY